MRAKLVVRLQAIVVCEVVDGVFAGLECVPFEHQSVRSGVGTADDHTIRN